MNSETSESNAVVEKIGKMLGTTLVKYGEGYAAEIRGKRYWFPSLTHAFDAARHGIGDYEVEKPKS